MDHQDVVIGIAVGVLSELSEEIPHIKDMLAKNMLAFQQDQAILDALNAQAKRMDRMQNRGNAILDALNAQAKRMDRMENRISNSQVCTINAKRLGEDLHAHLLPLRNITTGVVIPKFPKTMAELLHLNDAAVTGFLDALGITPPAGITLVEKVELLREKWVG
ncbi:hypothetical protein QBC46DRAFT_358898 [Diplogelasinospora grovesii]|uniref:Uncharacterized protein n=1 Tax=Diplogelasinospora grovesii TaxID=303347 RepID=A0AAN6MW77_9PEZI|nr:hypothetical protein QBC46DRAFT_358898 [Diplogelasinospora grovesii]